MKIEGMEFPEALEVLASRAGIELKREDPRTASERKRLYQICESAAKFFEEEFAKSSAVQAYMKERGVFSETIGNFRIGYAPDGWRNLTTYLAEKGFKPDEAERAGLAIRKQDSRLTIQDMHGYYDRFRNRIIFPIADGNGRIIGFGGRIFSADQHQSASPTEAKYINSPQTPLYDKSRVLYGFDKAKQEIRKKNQCILVEGYMDTVMSHQAGLTNTIAVSGTALTEEQLRAIGRLTDTLVSSFDSDDAGDKATARSLDLAGAFDFERKVAVIPEGFGKDPADVVLKSPDDWKHIVESAKNVVEFYFDRALARYDAAAPSGKKEIARAVLPKLVCITNEIERSHWMRRLTEVLDVSESAVWQEFERMRGQRQPNESRAAADMNEDGPGHEHSRKPTAKTRKQELEEKLVGMLLLNPQKISLINSGGIDLSLFSDERVRGALQYLTGSGEAETAFHNHLMFQTEVFLEGITDIDKEISLCFREFLRESIKEKLAEVSKKISHAEKGNNQDSLSTLLSEFQTLSQKLHAL